MNVITEFLDQNLMRLAQLARKIAVKPSEIVEFLADNNIQIENNSNAKISDDYVDLVIEYFAPELLNVEEPTTDAKKQEEIDKGSEKATEEIKVTELGNTAVIAQEDEVVIAPEVIKPAKVELPGLKVVGKIDLPEPKIKEEENPEPDETEKNEGSEVVASEELPRRKPRPENRRKVQSLRENDRLPRKNPIAMQREKEEREALRRRQNELEREKELRTQRYLKKVSTKVPAPKPMKKNKHEEEYEDYIEEEVKPKSVLGKILSWFVSK